MDPVTQFIRQHSDHSGVPSPVTGKVTVFDNAERMRLAAKGQAMPDGSFPIRNASDLHNALASYGRAKDPAAAKDWIKRRAAELGMRHVIPLHWVDAAGG